VSLGLVLQRARRSFFLWFGALWLVAGLLALGAGIREAREEAQWGAAGRAEGLVVDKAIERAERGGRPRTGYVVRYRFTTSAGQVVEGEDRVDVEAWEGMEPGARLPVQYRREAPGSSRLARPPAWGSPAVGIVLGGLVAAAGAGLFVRSALRLRRELRLLTRGAATRGTVLETAPSRTVVNGVPRWRIHYRYRDDRGRDREAWSEGLPAAAARGWRPGDTGAVRFDRERPEESVWVGTDTEERPL
jgi:hypothetical protein